MARTDRIFGRLQLGQKAKISHYYVQHLFETKAAFEGTPHVLWTGWTTEHGFPGHKVRDSIKPLNGFLLYAGEGFALAPDECAISICGVKTCMQTAHMRVLLKAEKFK